MNHDWTELDERYFEWLYDQVSHDEDRGPSRSHTALCETMYRSEYEWFVHRDENWAEHGRELRYLFLDETGLDADQDWLLLDCSIFEVLIALSKAAEFETVDMSVYVWFWIMVRNLELEYYTDDIYDERVHDTVLETLRRFIHREYDSSGLGGLFPLREPKGDQRKIELWYQLSAYMLENCDF